MLDDPPAKRMSPKIGVPPNHPFLLGFSIINHPFWDTTIFGNTHVSGTLGAHGSHPKRPLNCHCQRITPVALVTGVPFLLIHWVSATRWGWWETFSGEDEEPPKIGVF